MEVLRREGGGTYRPNSSVHTPVVRGVIRLRAGRAGGGIESGGCSLLSPSPFFPVYSLKTGNLKFFSPLLSSASSQSCQLRLENPTPAHCSRLTAPTGTLTWTATGASPSLSAVTSHTAARGSLGWTLRPHRECSHPHGQTQTNSQTQSFGPLTRFQHPLCIPSHETSFLFLFEPPPF